MGIEKGGWGLYLCPEDMAKIGQLFLQKGVWNGRRLVSAQFLGEMTSKKIDTPPEMGEQGYGYQVWMGKRPGSYLLNGILGQNIIVLPNADMVIVTTGGNDCLFKTSTVISLVEDYFEGPDFKPGNSLPPNRKALARLRLYERTARSRQAAFEPQEKRSFLSGWGKSGLPSECDLLDGARYKLETGGARLLPIFTQLMQNNYTTGIDEIAFAKQGDEFYMTVGEGQERNRIQLSFDGTPAESRIAVNREIYIVAASARVARDEDGNTVLKILLPFLENSNQRKMKLFFYRSGEMELQLSEVPDADSLLGDMGIYERKGLASLVNRLVARDDEDIFEYTVHRAIKPRASGKRIQPKQN